MSAFFRRLIAQQVAKTTGICEENILPCIKPLIASRKSVVSEYGLSVLPLFINKAATKIKPKQADLHSFAGNIASKITCPAHIHRIHVDKGGLIRFKVNPTSMVHHVLKEVQTKGNQYGLIREDWEGTKKKIIVEYSSPNIAKPFHAGHLRSTLIGNCIANVHAAMGHDVTRINFLGDWGYQFGLLSVGFKLFGSEDKLSADPIQHLYDIYVRANKEAKLEPRLYQEAQKFTQALEEGDSECISIWKRFRDFSIQDYSATYKRLGVSFDTYTSESHYGVKSRQLLSTLRSLNLLQKTGGGVGVVDLSDLISHPKSKSALLVKSNNTTLYLTRDVAAALDRYEQYSFDKMYYVVDKTQEIHFNQLRGVLRKMGLGWFKRCHHVKFGRVLGMRTRKGNVVLLKDILDEARSRMLHSMQSTASTKELSNPEEVAELLGVAAIIIQDLKGRLMSDYSFDWSRILTSKGDTGVFMQYTHARLYSIEQMSGIPLDPNCSTSHLNEPVAIRLANHLSLYNTAVTKAHDNLEPMHLVNYLLQLCHSASSAVTTLRVKDTPSEQAKARLLLFNSARITLANGMKILGITPVNQM